MAEIPCPGIKPLEKIEFMPVHGYKPGRFAGL